FGPGLIEGHVVIDDEVDLLELPRAVDTNILFVIIPEQPAADLLALLHHGAGHENAPLAGAAIAVHLDDEIHREMCSKDDLRGDPAEEGFEGGAAHMVAEIPAGPDRVLDE